MASGAEIRDFQQTVFNFPDVEKEEKGEKAAEDTDGEEIGESEESDKNSTEPRRKSKISFRRKVFSLLQ